MPPLGSSASRTPSRRKLPHAVLLLVGLVAGAALVFLGLVGADLWRDSRFGTRRADRWFPLTYPLLSRWAGEHREFALQALERQGHPYWLEALDIRLDSGWTPGSDWMSTRRWLRYGLLDDSVLLETVDRLGRRPVQQAAPVLTQLRDFLSSAWWLRHHARTYSMRLLRVAEQRGDDNWLRLLPYDLDPAAQDYEKRVGRRLYPRVAGAYARLDEIRSGLAGDPLANLDAHPGFLLDLLAENYADPACARALRTIFTTHWKRDPLGLEAGCVLLRCHDPETAAKFSKLANQELTTVTRWGLQPSYLESLVIGLPDSRLAQGCREYSAIRGADYFRSWPEPRFRRDLGLLPQAIAGAAREEQGWRRWLARYPDHPGADDARWWLARSLEWQGRRREALEVIALQLTAPLGDAACAATSESENEERISLAFEDRFRWLLDVGTTRADLERFLAEHPRHPSSTQVRYALAVRHARAHDYREALRLTEGLRLDLRYSAENLEYDPWLVTLTLANQRQRWGQLARHDLTARWGRLAVLNCWLKNDGWRNGYLLLYKGQRHWRISYAWYRSEADPTGRPDEKVIRQNYRDANPNMVALQLIGPQDGADGLFLQTLALYKQWAMYPLEESSYVGGDEQWFLTRAEQAAAKLTALKDKRGAVAWWHCYNLSPKTKHLQNVIDHYPEQADWARALLPTPEEPLMQWWNRWF